MTHETLDFLGAPAWIKASGETTDGRVAVIECVDGPRDGSPLHRHTREDEWFYVLEGQLTLWVGGETITAPQGSVAFAPNDVPHTFVVSSPEPARYLMVVQPAGFEHFVRAASQPGVEMNDLDGIAADYGLEILGPPGIPEAPSAGGGGARARGSRAQGRPRRPRAR